MIKLLIKHTEIIRRCLARLFDLLLILAVMSVAFDVLQFFLPSKLSSFYELIVLIMALFSALVVEAASIHFFAASFGKFLLGMRFLTYAQQKPSFLIAFKRTWSVFWRSVLYYSGLILPLVCLKVFSKLSIKGNVPYGFGFFLILISVFVFVKIAKKIIVLVKDLRTNQQTFLDRYYQTKVVYYPVNLKSWMLFLILLVLLIIFSFKGL